MDIRNILIILHIIGTVLGAGAATVTDYLIFKFTKDKKIDKHEFKILNIISDIVWGGLMVLLATAAGFVYLYIQDIGSVRDAYNVDKLLAKITVVVILTLNGFFIHRFVLPALKQRLGKSLKNPAFLKNSAFIFSPGAISSVSWYTALVLGAWRSLEATYSEIMAVYGILVVGAIFIANITGKRFLQK